MTRLVWFRSDLRLADNPAFFHALQAAAAEKSSVIAAFIASPKEWKSHDVSPHKVDFILRNLKDLSDRLWSFYRIPLLIRTASSAGDVLETLKELISTHHVDSVYMNAEYEVNEGRRDQKVMDAIQAGQWEPAKQVHRYDDQCVVLPGLLRSKGGEGNVYTVYSPFKKSWYQYVYTHKKTLELYGSYAGEGKPTQFEKFTFKSPSTFAVQPDAVPTQVEGFPLSLTSEQKKVVHALWPAGEDVAQKRLATFATTRAIQDYDDQRNLMANEKGTSGLSTYLASGVLSTKQCVVAALQQNNQRLDSGNKGIVTWISELIWRDFYRHILVAYPRVCMNKPFKLDTMTVAWRFEKEEFEAWCQGRTGYPIVDAGMRQLNATGWIHNRARMIVGSFLTKHLLHNWQMGESYFMRHQIDGDFASNNGGWQWVASTGTDAQPYFRVFNPLLQSKRFDPKGEYIRRWIPELRDVKNADALHDPVGVLGKDRVLALGYALPIVQHELGRNRAIAAFKKNAERLKQGREEDVDLDEVVEEKPARKKPKTKAK